MELFREAAFKRAASDPTRLLTVERKETLNRCLLRLYPAARTNPDHPPYAAMIHRAITELNEEGGSSKEAISKFITAEYDALPWVPSDFLNFHLASLCESGEIFFTASGCYLIPSSEPGPADVPNKTLKRSKRRMRRRRQREPLYRSKNQGKQEVLAAESIGEEDQTMVRQKNSEVEKIELVGVADNRKETVIDLSKKPRRWLWRRCKENVVPKFTPIDVATSFDAVIGSLQEQEIQSDQPDRSGWVVSEIQSEVSISETPHEHNLPTQVKANASLLPNQPHLEQQMRLCKKNMVPECSLKDVSTSTDVVIGPLLKQEIQSNQPNISGKTVSNQSEVSTSERPPEINLLPTQVEANVSPLLKQPQLKQQPECAFSCKPSEIKLAVVDSSQEQKQPWVCKEQISFEQHPLKRGRGRPPKRKLVAEKIGADSLLLEPQHNNQQKQQPPPKRSRGRPRKAKVEVDESVVQSPPNCQHNDMQQ